MIPATTPHAHTAITLRINIEAAYAKAGLIEVLRGGMPPKADEIVVVPMDDIGEPPPDRVKELIAYRLAVEKNRVAIPRRLGSLLPRQLQSARREGMEQHMRSMSHAIVSLLWLTEPGGQRDTAYS